MTELVNPKLTEKAGQVIVEPEQLEEVEEEILEDEKEEEVEKEYDGERMTVTAEELREMM